MTTKEEQFDDWYKKVFVDTGYVEEAFKRVAKEYYDRNFSTLAKTQADLLMFNILNNGLYAYFKMISKETEANSENKGPKNPDAGTMSRFLKSSEYSDYSLSNQLGITKRKISGLKERSFQVYGFFDESTSTDSEWWNSIFIDSLSTARYDPSKGKCTIKISDPNVQNALEHYLETEIGESEYLEATFTKGVLLIRADTLAKTVCKIFDLKTLSKRFTKEHIRNYKKYLNKSASEDEKDRINEVYDILCSAYETIELPDTGNETFRDKAIQAMIDVCTNASANCFIGFMFRSLGFGA